jgi:NAD(P)H-dependent FMN reductase
MHNTPLTIAVLAGTSREQRLSIRAAQYVAEMGKQYDDVEIIFVDPKDFTFNGDGNDPEAKTRATAKSSPKLTHSLSSLQNTITASLAV